MERQAKHIVILGAGRFGRLAAGKYRRLRKRATVTIIDHDPERLKNLPFKTVCQDGIVWLAEHIHTDAPEIIIPAVPIHVAAEWLRYMLIQNGKQCVPAQFPDYLLQSLPHSISAEPGRIFTSFADFICPAACEEPEGYCPHSGEKRAIPLFTLIENRCPEGFEPIVLQSQQIFPGTGGILSQDLFAAYSRVTALTPGKFLIATACSCHGVVDALQIS